MNKYYIKKITWIPTAIELPETYLNVLCCVQTKSGLPHFPILFRVRPKGENAVDKWFVSGSSDFHDSDRFNVTHWVRDIPAPDSYISKKEVMFESPER